MSDLAADNKQSTSSPTSTVSNEDIESSVPSNLASQELQLALTEQATEQELLKAINHTKVLILENAQCSLERKWLVRHLIELRFKLQECREAMADPEHPRNKSSGVSNRTVMGHHLKLQPLLRAAAHRYCDHCTGTIWSVVQAWYECQDCGYTCHHKCIALIVRECAHVVACERGEYELQICPDRGLSFQKYMCAECKSPLMLKWSDAKLCDYSGRYFCSACHWNGSAVIPARAVHNWDLVPQPVSQASLQQLKITAQRPLINLERVNPKLFALVHELNLVRRLRRELVGLRKYVSVCRRATEERLLWKCDRPYLLESSDMYSLQDLVDTHAGELPSKLHSLVDLFTRHVKVECEICRGRAHICEICSNDEALYPFDRVAYVCAECGAVLHKQCRESKGSCPRCVRLRDRRAREANENENCDT
ncbi:differentially expressed in FDCP 8 homolog isoform X2 [Cylas formicarius]|uniref:differentially expressed in FDCP 8 homolog isoform X2 n=1 Tax=Cylas formicarius TaxID=197179 RepID=UPI002958A426|nr:differentially expressed in FDCP 8 homolog isoform X2 [Cylas formicarius]